MDIYILILEYEVGLNLSTLYDFHLFKLKIAMFWSILNMVLVLVI